MGDIKSLMNMIPGASKLLKDVDIDNSAFGKVECLIFSMTPNERSNPLLLLTDKTSHSRKQRIAKGCGKTMQEVNMFLKQFDEMRKMMHSVSTGNLPKGMQAPRPRK